MNGGGTASVWIKLALELAGEAVKRINALGLSRGAQVVQVRDSGPEGGRNWDPGILQVDREVEEYCIEQLAERGIDTILLSEEAGRVKVEPRCAPEVEYDRPIYLVLDPFDGSVLYKRSIPAFWYSCLAIYTRPARLELAESLASVVINCADRSVCYCDTRTSYEAKLSPEGTLTECRQLAPKATKKLSEAYLETYLMKPNYMYPAVEKFRFLFRGVKVILPNGGPSGFCDVASGKVDVYFACKQPHTDIFPGLAVAERAGCCVTTFEGRKVAFEEAVRKRYNLVCSANVELHSKVLNLLKQHGITDSAGFEDD
jgi:fructose-1,6-bisphosphatase/inositol monophosphatase family enzyme